LEINYISTGGVNRGLPLITRLKRYIDYIRISNANEVARRYFVINSFDGTVTALGIILGALIANIQYPGQVIDVGVATGLALLISGITGTSIAEEAERDKIIRELEASMLTDMRNTIFEKAQRFAILYVGIVDGVSSFLSVLIALGPVFASAFGFIDLSLALQTSIVVCLIYLGVLGIFIGSYAKRSILKETLKLIGIGILTTIVVTILLYPT